MNARTNRLLVALVAASALGVTACNPYPAATGGTPQIVRVLAFDSGARVDPPTVTESPDASGAWLVSNAPQGSYGASPLGATGKRLGIAVQVQFNKQLDGTSVQATTANCVPKPGVFTVTPAPAASETWYACYSPGNPDTTVGSTIIFYKAENGTTASPPSTDPYGNDPRKSVYEPATNYRVTGSVMDQGGNSVAIDLTVKVSGERIDGPTVTDTSTVVISWPAADGGAGAVTYDVERAGNYFNGFVDNPTTFAPLPGATGLSVLTWTDTTVSTGKYWYRITAHYAQNGTFASGAASMATVP